LPIRICHGGKPIPRISKESEEINFISRRFDMELLYTIALTYYLRLSSALTQLLLCILSSPADTPYTILKTSHIQSTVGSNQQKLQCLFVSVELGDQKPSQLLRRMRQFWDASAGDALLVPAILAVNTTPQASTQADLESLASERSKLPD